MKLALAAMKRLTRSFKNFNHEAVCDFIQHVYYPTADGVPLASATPPAQHRILCNPVETWAPRTSAHRRSSQLATHDYPTGTKRTALHKPRAKPSRADRLIARLFIQTPAQPLPGGQLIWNDAYSFQPANL